MIRRLVEGFTPRFRRARSLPDGSLALGAIVASGDSVFSHFQPPRLDRRHSRDSPFRKLSMCERPRIFDRSVQQTAGLSESKVEVEVI